MLYIADLLYATLLQSNIKSLQEPPNACLDMLIQVTAVSLERNTATMLKCSRKKSTFIDYRNSQELSVRCLAPID